MTEGEVHALLRRVDPVSGWRRGEIAWLRERIEQSGGDPAEVEACVRRWGGWVERLPVTQALPRFKEQQSTRLPLVLVVPEAAFAEMGAVGETEQTES